VSHGKVYVGGDFTVIGGLERNRIAALSALTGTDSSWWNPSADEIFYAIVVSDGTVYAEETSRTLGEK